MLFLSEHRHEHLQKALIPHLPRAWLSPKHAFILRVTPGYAKIQVNKFPVLTLSYILPTWNILGSTIGVNERSIVDGCPSNFFLPFKCSFDFLAINFIHICLFTWREGERERGVKERERKRKNLRASIMKSWQLQSLVKIKGTKFWDAFFEMKILNQKQSVDLVDIYFL